MPEFTDFSGGKLRSITIRRDVDSFLGTVSNGDNIKVHDNGFDWKGPAVADKETSLAMKLFTSDGCSKAEG